MKNWHDDLDAVLTRWQLNPVVSTMNDANAFFIDVTRRLMVHYDATGDVHVCVQSPREVIRCRMWGGELMEFAQHGLPTSEHVEVARSLMTQIASVSGVDQSAIAKAFGDPIVGVPFARAA